MTPAPPDLARDVLEQRLPGRALRTYPAMLSTEADAIAWARRGAPDGALVVAGYQASPRGRAGLAWGGAFSRGQGLGFSVVLRPDLSPEREGWLYAVATLALVDAIAPEDDRVTIAWPDRLVRGSEVVAAVGVQAEAGTDRLDWAVLTLLLPGCEPPRTDMLVAVADALEQWRARDVDTARHAYARRCGTLGTRVRARLLPLGPSAPAVLGHAADLAPDGGLVIVEEATRARAVVLPQALGFLEDPDDDAPGPSGR